MIDKLQTIIERYDTLAELMSRPDAMHNMKAFTQLAREHSGLTELVELSKKYIDTYKQLQEDEEILKWNELNLNVGKISFYLKKINIKEKDRVAAYLPNLIETVESFLATVSIGAIWSSCSPDFGVSGVIENVN